MKLASLSISLGFLFLCGMAPRAGAASTNKPEEVKLWFPVGETMIYKLYWGVLPVGRAEFSSEWTEEDGRKLLRLTAEARTTSVVAKIYPVDDQIESIVDPKTFLPVRYEQRIHEGRRKRHDITTFDHKKLQAIWTSGKKKRKKLLAIDADTRDLLSLVYFMRAKGLKIGEQAKFRVLVDDNLYGLETKGVKHEKVKVRGMDSKVKCLLVEPKAKFGEIFLRKGKVRLWFSEDPRRLCVRMMGKVPLANVKALLIRVTGPGKDKWVKKKE